MIYEAGSCCWLGRSRRQSQESHRRKKRKGKGKMKKEAQDWPRGKRGGLSMSFSSPFLPPPFLIGVIFFFKRYKQYVSSFYLTILLCYRDFETKYSEEGFYSGMSTSASDYP